MNIVLFSQYLLAFVLGSVAGSFVNVVIYRLPSIAVSGLRPGATLPLRYLAWPLSFCPYCGTGIKPWLNIPVISWLVLRGKSSCCDKPISPRYLAVEFMGALAAVACLHRFGFSSFVLFGSIFCCALIALSWIDVQRYLLPDIIVQPLLWMGLCVNLYYGHLEGAVLGAIGGYLFLAAVSEGTVLLMHKRMLGAGDPKLFAAIGAWLGWQVMPAVLVIAAVTAVIFGVGRQVLARGGYDGKAMLPFGPFLSVGAAVMLFFGNWIVPLYMGRLW